MSCSLLVLLAMAGGVGGALAPTVSWAGIPTTTGVRLAVQPADESASLVVSARRDLSAPVATLRVTRDKFVVDVQGLAPETQYYYGLAADYAAAGGARAAEFRTPSASPRAPFRVAVGACGWSSGNGAVFANIAELEPRPLVFIHAGDLHYQDIGEDSLPRFEAAFQGVHAGEAAQLFRTVPLMYTWDDHDFGDNNAMGSSPSRSAALAAFRKYVPATLAGEAGEGVYQSYEVQGVLFIVTGAGHVCATKTCVRNAGGRVACGSYQTFADVHWLQTCARRATRAPERHWGSGKGSGFWGCFHGGRSGGL